MILAALAEGCVRFNKLVRELDGRFIREYVVDAKRRNKRA